MASATVTMKSQPVPQPAVWKQLPLITLELTRNEAEAIQYFIKRTMIAQERVVIQGLLESGKLHPTSLNAGALAVLDAVDAAVTEAMKQEAE
jgi:hypothetical protein